MNIALRANHDLKEDIRSYWSDRSRTFDHDFGHRIADGPEFLAWATAIRRGLGDRRLRILELACGTGEITRVLLSLGHEVTALDFSDAMLDVARRKHAGNPDVRFILADAENTMEPDGIYDAIVCRHLVWTLTEPDRAFVDWYRVLAKGGRLLIFDGNWARPTRAGYLIQRFLRLFGGARPSDGDMPARHAAIMQRLPFGDGLTGDTLARRLASGGFEVLETTSQAQVARGQRRSATFANRLRTLIYQKFILLAQK